MGKMKIPLGCLCSDNKLIIRSLLLIKGEGDRNQAHTTERKIELGCTTKPTFDPRACYQSTCAPFSALHSTGWSMTERERRGVGSCWGWGEVMSCRITYHMRIMRGKETGNIIGGLGNIMLCCKLHFLFS